MLQMLLEISVERRRNPDHQSTKLLHWQQGLDKNMHSHMK